MTIAEAPERIRKGTPPSAVAWIGDRHAVVAEIDATGHIMTCTIERQGAPEQRYVALVVEAIGDRQRVVILGPGNTRLLLERAYVSIYHRPDRLVDVEEAGAVAEADLVRRLRELAA
jgi:hypothetical protein